MRDLPNGLKKPAKRRPQDNVNGPLLKYPPMYNESQDSREQLRMSDMEAQDSGDPFLNLDAKDDQSEFEHFSVGPQPELSPAGPPGAGTKSSRGDSRSNRLRKKGPPPARG